MALGESLVKVDIDSPLLQEELLFPSWQCLGEVLFCGLLWRGNYFWRVNIQYYTGIKRLSFSFFYTQ